MDTNNKIDNKRALQAETLRQKKFIEARQKDLKRIDHTLNQAENDLRLKNEESIRHLKNEHQKAVIEENIKQEQALHELLNKYSKQMDDFENQQTTQSLFYRDKFEDVEKRSTSRLDTMENEFRDKGEEIKQETDHAIAMLTVSEKQKVDDANFDKREKLSELQYQNSVAINDQNILNEAQIKKAQSDHQSFLAQEILAQKKILSDNKKNYAHDLKQDEARYLSQKQFLQNRHQQVLQDEQSNFESKYNQLKMQHEQALQVLKDNLAKTTQSMQKSAQNQLQFFENRSIDPFYTGNALSPVITEDEKNYFVNVSVPDFEKDQVQLSGNDRELRLSFARTMENEVQGGMGETDRTKRSEFHQKKFSLPEIINIKGLKKNYTDGLLTFVIPKK